MGFTNTSIVTEGDAEYTHLQRQLDGYERLRQTFMETQTQPGDALEELDNTDSFPTPSTSTVSAVSMESEEVRSRYMHPLNHSHEYLELVDHNGRSTVPASEKFADQAASMSREDEYTTSRTQSCLYEDIPASLIKIHKESGSLLQQGQYEGYVNYVDYSDYESLYNQVVSTGKQDNLGNYHQPNTIGVVSFKRENGYGSTCPKIQYEGYVDVIDYSEIPESLTNQKVSMETEEDSAHSQPQIKQEGCVKVTDYRNSFTTDSDSFTSGTVSLDDSMNRQSSGYKEIPSSIKEQSDHPGNNISKNQQAIPKKGISKETDIKSMNCDNTEGYVDYVDYAEWQDITNKANPLETDEEAEYTCPHSQSEGYVGMVDYTGSVPTQSDDFSSKATSMEIENESLQASSDGYEKLKESVMTSDESGYTHLRSQTPEYLEILGEPETRPQSQHVGYVDVVDYTESVPTHKEKLQNRAAFNENVKEYDDIYSESQHEGYVGIVEYTDSIQSANIEGFSNETVSTVSEDGSGYTHLRRQLSGYEKLRHPALKTVDESARYMDILEYNDLNLSENNTTESKSDKIGRQSQYDGYVGISDYPDTLETFNNIGDSRKTQEKSASTRPQSQISGYVPITEYHDTIATMETQQQSGNSRPQSQADGYVPITEYHDIVGKQEVSIETESVSTCSESQASGYVPITEYHDIVGKQEVSIETESVSTCSESQASGYVPITEYHDIVGKQEVSIETESASTLPESQECGYVHITDYSDSLLHSSEKFTKKAMALATEDERSTSTRL